MNATEIAQLIVDDEADDIFVNASDKKLEKKETRWVTLFVESKNFYDINHYGDFYNFAKPKTITEVDEITAEVMKALQNDYEDEKITPRLDDTIRNAGEDFDELGSLMNPDNIIDSAGIWDDEDFVDWFFDTFPLYYFVQTYDGAVSHMSLFKGQIVSVDTDEFDELYDELL